MLVLTEGERKALLHAALLVSLAVVGRLAVPEHSKAVSVELLTAAGNVDSAIVVAESLRAARSKRLGPGERVDLNRAAAAELERLPGIGPVLARAIIEARSRRGAFSSLAELEQVPGFGSTRLNRLAPYVAPLPLDGRGVGGPGHQPWGSGSATRLDLNRASVEELAQLPGIGPVKAAAIISWRNRNGPIRSLGDLTQVPGIGPKTVEKLRQSLDPGS